MNAENQVTQNFDLNTSIRPKFQTLEFASANYKTP